MEQHAQAPGTAGTEQAPGTEPEDLAVAIAELAQHAGTRIAVAESLTGGQLAGFLAAAPSASAWFRGGIVAYASDVKFDLLDVPRGPVVSETAARAMAEGAARLLGADLTVAVTGVGGPDPQDDQPPGTVWLAIAGKGRTRAVLHRFPESDPPTICRLTCIEALRSLRQTLTDGDAAPNGGAHSAM